MKGDNINMKEFTLTFDANEINYILNVLAKEPYINCHTLIEKIIAECKKD